MAAWICRPDLRHLPQPTLGRDRPLQREGVRGGGRNSYGGVGSAGSLACLTLAGWAPPSSFKTGKVKFKQASKQTAALIDSIGCLKRINGVPNSQCNISTTLTHLASPNVEMEAGQPFLLPSPDWDIPGWQSLGTLRLCFPSE